MLGAAYGHIRETVMRGDYAPYNFFTIFSDGITGVALVEAALHLIGGKGGAPTVMAPRGS